MAAADTLLARQGDTLDELLWRERGLGPAALAETLVANPGLGGIGVVLPLGTAVIVPASVPTAAAAPLVNLWD